jgi:tRNA U34 5-methylaminomethyl-2-thiouridine-forming methyltransferase MnmC
MALFITEDGSHSVLSETFGIAYHSTHGAIQETQHVFIDAGLKYTVEQGLTEIAILEIGFGTGLNAFMTFLEAQRLGVKINYTTFEAYPLSMEQVFQLNYVEKLEIPNFKNVFESLHTSSWADMTPLSNTFNFTKILADFDQIQFKNSFDIIYFDAFAPQAQPHLWETEMMQKMYSALKNNGILTTYCAKGEVKRVMKSVGFTIEKLAGPPGKREMTRAFKK